MHHGSVVEDAGVNIGSNISIMCLGSMAQGDTFPCGWQRWEEGGFGPGGRCQGCFGDYR